jgi:hypothetical protein
MTMSKIALFAFALAAILVTNFQHANAASRRAFWADTTNSFVSDLDDARFDHDKGVSPGLLIGQTNFPANQTVRR